MDNNDVFKNTPKAMKGWQDKVVEDHTVVIEKTLGDIIDPPKPCMNSVDQQYNDLFYKIMEEGEWSNNRTGIRTKSIFGEQIKMDIREGFPIFTSRQMPFKSFVGELECFIQGYTSKEKFKERGCFWWESWCNPQKVPYGNDDETKAKMKLEDDLGLVYGSQWRNFQDPEAIYSATATHGEEVNVSSGRDQFASMVENIKAGIDDRRLIVLGWNPLATDHMALVPCHYSFTVHLSPCGKYLDLKWNQRSVDLALGANNTLYGILIHLLAHECGRIPRYLIASYENVHIYENQIEMVMEQLQRETHKLPTLKIKTGLYDSIFDWKHDMVELVDYKHSGVLKFPPPAV